MSRHSARQLGFSLVEVLVALAVTSLLFIAALSLLSIDHKIYSSTDATLEAAREGRHTVETLERDLLMTGYLVDTNTVADIGPDGTTNTGDDIVGAPKFVYAAPWDLVVNADIDSRVGAIQDGATGDSLPIGYAPITFHTGAETVRYTLDSTGDGTVSSADRGDEPEESITANTGLFLLRREVYGYNGSNNVNASGPIAMVRGPVNYPSGIRPQPLFEYWGEFDSDAALDLWGDTGAGGGTAGNGTLEAGELAALTAITDEDLDNDNTIDSGEDRNGNSILDRGISSIIKKVVMHVTTETLTPDKDYRDALRSSSTTPFRYHVYTLNSEIRPRNIDLPGGQCGNVPARTTSPTVVNACSNALADGTVQLGWTLSADDGGGEHDVAKYIVYRTTADNLFGASPFSEVAAGVATMNDNQINARTWPPQQVWYRVKAMDCTPQLSENNPTAGPYPALVGASYPADVQILDRPGDDGTALDVSFLASPDDPSNTTGFGGGVRRYHVYRSTSSDYRCVPPVNNAAITATGATSYTYVDNATNSVTAPVFGQLYYYWLRSVDTALSLSPYSPSYCGRPYQGPVLPATVSSRTVPRSSSDHPVELYFLPNDRNVTGGYDPYQLRYRIYRSHDINSDGTADSLVDNSVGYRPGDRQTTVAWQGLVWALARNSSTIDVKHSIDGGTYWRSAGELSSENLHGIAFGSRLDGVIVGTAGAILRSSTGGTSWAAATSGITDDLRAVAFSDPNQVVAVGDNGALLRSGNAGATWTAIASGFAQRLLGVDGVDNEFFVVGRNGAATRSTDGGRNWTTVNFTTDDMHSACIAKEAGGAITLWAGADSKLWHSVDGGTSWTMVPLGTGEISDVDCVPGGSVIAIDAGSRTIFSTTDGVLWSASLAISSTPTAVGMLDANLAFVVDTAGRLHSRDGAGAWTSTMVDYSMNLSAVAVRPEIAWEDSTTAAAATGSTFYYTVTTSYAVGSSTLDGESGVTPDRPSSLESPDDSDDQILIDSCNNHETVVTMP